MTIQELIAARGQRFVDAVQQLYAVATNEEFTAKQRMELMVIALDEYHEGLLDAIDCPVASSPIKPDGELAGALLAVSEEADKQGFKSALDGMVSDFKSTENGKIAEKQFVDFMVDKALGRHLTRETLPNGGIRFGLSSGGNDVY